MRETDEKDAEAGKTDAKAKAEVIVGIDGELAALRAVIAIAAEWIWEQDAELRFTAFRGASPGMTKEHWDSALGRRRWELPISGVSHERLADHVRTCERREPFHDFVYMMPGRDGTPQFHSVSGVPVHSPSGAFAGYRGVGRNVTGSRMAEQALRDGRRRLAQIIEGSPVPTFVLDAEHRVVHWNRACARLTGKTEADMIGRDDAWRIFYSEKRPCLADLVLDEAGSDDVGARYVRHVPSKVIDEGYETVAFCPGLGTDGLWLHCTAAPIRSHDGEIVGAVETVQDISERKKAEQEEARRIAEREIERGREEILARERRKGDERKAELDAIAQHVGTFIIPRLEAIRSLSISSGMEIERAGFDGGTRERPVAEQTKAILDHSEVLLEELSELLATISAAR